MAALDKTENGGYNFKQDQLWHKIKKLAVEIEYGSFVTRWDVHGGELRQAEVEEVKRKFRVE